ncbi:MAG: hypothetical protein WBH97_04515, partial [Rectinemataceae bacterium]
MDDSRPGTKSLTSVTFAIRFLQWFSLGILIPIALAFMIASCLVFLPAHGFTGVTFGFVLYGIYRAFSSGSIEALLIDRQLELHGEGSLHRFMSMMG